MSIKWNDINVNPKLGPVNYLGQAINRAWDLSHDTMRRENGIMRDFAFYGKKVSDHTEGRLTTARETVGDMTAAFEWMRERWNNGWNNTEGPMFRFSTQEHKKNKTIVVDLFTRFMDPMVVGKKDEFTFVEESMGKVVVTPQIVYARIPSIGAIWEEYDVQRGHEKAVRPVVMAVAKHLIDHGHHAGD